LGAVDDAESAALGLLAAQLRVGYLWERIRVRGGAYGARSAWSRSSGSFGVASYRDPHVKQTLAVYDGLGRYIAEEMELSPQALEQAIIGTFKGIDRPLRPGSVVGQTLSRQLSGDSAELRQRRREALLALDADTVRRVGAQRLGPAVRAAPLCVLSSREKLEAARGEGLERELEISDL
jgi:Zn-dependent M16 (insulinase) family peptidase